MRPDSFFAQRPRVKICCINSVEEARLAVRYGASALGLVSEMPSGPGVISEEEISEIARIIPPGVASFLLTSKQNAEAVIEQQKRCRVNTIQLVDELIEGEYSDLRQALPGVALVQVVHVVGEESIEKAKEVAPFVDAVLLDSGNPNLEIKELGGTGRTHNWEISRKLCATIEKPVFLAGGLNPENVAKAVKSVQPYGIDVCNGVRTNDALDAKKLSSFFNQLL